MSSCLPAFLTGYTPETHIQTRMVFIYRLSYNKNKAVIVVIITLSLYQSRCCPTIITLAIGGRRGRHSFDHTAARNVHAKGPHIWRMDHRQQGHDSPWLRILRSRFTARLQKLQRHDRLFAQNVRSAQQTM